MINTYIHIYIFLINGLYVFAIIFYNPKCLKLIISTTIYIKTTSAAILAINNNG